MKTFAEFSAELPAGLLEVAKKVYEGDEDYGYTFYQPSSGKVFVCVGDSNEDVEEIQEQLDMIDELSSITIENESTPDYDEGWLAIDVKKGDLIEWNDGAEHLVFTK